MQYPSYVNERSRVRRLNRKARLMRNASILTPQTEQRGTLSAPVSIKSSDVHISESLSWPEMEKHCTCDVCISRVRSEVWKGRKWVGNRTEEVKRTVCRNFYGVRSRPACTGPRGRLWICRPRRMVLSLPQINRAPSTKPRSAPRCRETGRRVRRPDGCRWRRPRRLCRLRCALLPV